MDRALRNQYLGVLPQSMRYPYPHCSGPQDFTVFLDLFNWQWPLLVSVGATVSVEATVSVGVTVS